MSPAAAIRGAEFTEPLLRREAPDIHFIALKRRDDLVMVLLCFRAAASLFLCQNLGGAKISFCAKMGSGGGGSITPARERAWTSGASLLAISTA